MFNITADCSTSSGCLANPDQFCFKSSRDQTPCDPLDCDPVVVAFNPASAKQFQATGQSTPSVVEELTQSQFINIIKSSALVVGLMFALLFSSLIAGNAPWVARGGDAEGLVSAAHSATLFEKTRPAASSPFNQCVMTIVGALNHSGSNPLRRRIQC